MTMLIYNFFCSQEELENGYVWSTKMLYSISTGILENLAKHSCLTGSFHYCRDKPGEEKLRKGGSKWLQRK